MDHVWVLFEKVVPPTAIPEPGASHCVVSGQRYWAASGSDVAESVLSQPTDQSAPGFSRPLRPRVRGPSPVRPRPAATRRARVRCFVNPFVAPGKTLEAAARTSVCQVIGTSFRKTRVGNSNTAVMAAKAVSPVLKNTMMASSMMIDISMVTTAA